MGSGKVAVGDIDGDALLPLGAQPVGKLGKIDCGGDIRGGGFGDGAHMIFVDVLRVVQQPADQRRLAIIHAARGAEAHQVFGLLRGEKILH